MSVKFRDTSILRTAERELNVNFPIEWKYFVRSATNVLVLNKKGAKF